MRKGPMPPSRLRASAGTPATDTAAGEEGRDREEARTPAAAATPLAPSAAANMQPTPDVTDAFATPAGGNKSVAKMVVTPMAKAAIDSQRTPAPSSDATSAICPQVEGRIVCVGCAPSA